MTEVGGQAARHVLAVARTLGVAQGPPGVVEGALHGAVQRFAEGDATGQGAGQGAAGAMVAAGQALAGEGAAAAVAAVQAIVHFAFVAVSAGDQQVLAVFQQALGALVGAALGQVGEQARFRQVRRGDGGARQQPLAHGEADVALAQRTAAAGAQHRIADHRQVRVGGEDLGHRVDHLQRTEHTQLDRRDGQVGEYGVGLGQHPLAVEDAEVADVDGVLHGQRGDRRGGVAALGEQGFDVGLQSGATTGVVTGQAEHYGAGSRCFHGA